MASFFPLEKALGVTNISIAEEGKLAVSFKVGEGAVSLFFDRNNIDQVEVYDPENLLKGGVYYVSLKEALKLILDN